MDTFGSRWVEKQVKRPTDVAPEVNLVLIHNKEKIEGSILTLNLKANIVSSPKRDITGPTKVFFSNFF